MHASFRVTITPDWLLQPLAIPSARDDVARAESGPTNRLYRPELDILRFFAFLCVFCAHAGAVDADSGFCLRHPALAHVVQFLSTIGAFGLSLFFLLSSFLITSLLLEERRATGRVHLRTFYMRRILRIWPLYLTLLAFVFVLGQFWPCAHLSARELVSYLLLSANWYQMIHAPHYSTNAVLYLWSISVEEQFYLIWGALLCILQLSLLRNACIGLMLLSFLYIGVASHNVPYANVWFDSGVQVVFFAAGGLLACQCKLWKPRRSARIAMCGFVVCLIFWAVANRGFFDQPFVSPRRSIAAFACSVIGSALLLIAALHMPSAWIRPRLVYLGRVSYGLYAFHGLVLLFVTHFIGRYLPLHSWALLALALTIVLASLSYTFLEKPFLRLKHRFEVTHARSA